jgi:hypothetical protein
MDQQNRLGDFEANGQAMRAQRQYNGDACQMASICIGRVSLVAKICRRNSLLFSLNRRFPACNM